MLNLFSTSSETAGFRLKYMEIYNWGTFHEKIFRMEPDGNNALLTGANASGKSTVIDALLTLMVPAKKDRFYNQSSGVEKKGNRTEETYVLGHYGNLQREGEKGTSTQALRDQSAYSILLAVFTNTDQRTVCVFQVRWFSGGELRRTFGLAHHALEIQKDFLPFDGKGVWRRRMETNCRNNRQKVEFFEGPTGYAERMTQLFGMRSVKALALFNQIVGVKVLDDLDEFIRTNMLEEQNAEEQYIQLKESFTTLIDAKNNIEKAKEQIRQLKPIDELARQIEAAEEKLQQLNTDRETAVYWFARKSIDLANQRLTQTGKSQVSLQKELKQLREKEEKLREEERSLSMAIENDEKGRQIRELENDIRRLGEQRDKRLRKREAYNRLAEQCGLRTDPDKKAFEQQKEKAAELAESQTRVQEEIIRSSIEAENGRARIREMIEERIGTIDSLQKNKNNIPVQVSEIRDRLLAETGATKEEIPFIGELIRIRPEEQEWEASVEKILHHFALHLIVPEKYYRAVNRYINETDLKGRITYFRYRTYSSLSGMDGSMMPAHLLLQKVELKPDSAYTEWLWDTINEKYNYACVDDLEEFDRYGEKAVTREGLVKFTHERHEKDDRPHITRKENFVLGWENREKIRLLQQEIRDLQQEEQKMCRQMEELEQNKRKAQELYENLQLLTTSFGNYEEIDWEKQAQALQAKLNDKEELERNNDHIQTLQKQLNKVREQLKQTVQEDIEQKSRQLYEAESVLKHTHEELEENRQLIDSLTSVLLTDFEQTYAYLRDLEYDQLKKEQQKFQQQNEHAIKKWAREKRVKEDEAKIKITEFKHPDEEVTTRFKDWRADVDAMPDAVHIELIGEYSRMLARLEKENLPKYEKQFDSYLQKTLTDKVAEYRMFFMNWTDSIRESIGMLNESLHGIDYKSRPATYIQLTAVARINEDAREFKRMLDEAMPDLNQIQSMEDGRRLHFDRHIEPFMRRLEDEEWRKRVTDARNWFSYRAEEFNQATGNKENTYENMGHLSGGEKAQLTYTILGSAIAYQFGLTKNGLQNNSFRFIAIDEAFKAQDEDKARYLITLCRQLHLQLLVVTPNDNIHIVENDISFVYFVERKEEKTSWLYSMPIGQWMQEKNKNLASQKA